ncbi:matrixin family metalloprotease [Ruegeria aquimaris]|uniref:Matrixin family metalloprotease n=1 Tax=Ruegeria aquimaris TaxID=2984333 RepID=A0ABT3ASU4_9RHOB|nr:matrixin family metalloprotease [Ruegeria sp. XHP0148]MCV2891367.1 matrixin family metalloprotease [Ruegeria sp. XHP0148]
MPVSRDLLSLIGDENTLRRWNVDSPLGTPTAVTFSFPDVLPDYHSESIPGFQSFGAQHRAHVRTALETWGNAGGLTFVEVPSEIGGQITFSMRDMTGLTNSVGNPLSGYGFYPSYYSVTNSLGERLLQNEYLGVGGDIFMNADYYAAAASTIAPGIRGYSILLHEIGHALGLKHPFESGPTITPGHDNGTFTVMSYDRPRSTTTLGSVDFEAIRYLYGTTGPNAFWNATETAVEQQGTTGADLLNGFEIDDILFGHDGDDDLRGKAGNDQLYGGAGDDRLFGGPGDDRIFGGTGANDRAVFDARYGLATIEFIADQVIVTNTEGRGSTRYRTELDDIELLEFSDQTVAVADLRPSVDRTGTVGDDSLTGEVGDDRLDGAGGNDTLVGDYGNDLLLGGDGNDELVGGNGADTLNGGDGDDTITGGGDENDLRDVVYAGEGNDSVDAGAGNDLVYGQGGNDTIAGGAGVDDLQGQDGDDVITGSSFSDLVYGGAGDDFVNGGFGHDRINGGLGADRFFHVGVEGHGSDWVQDYNASEGDVLLFGNETATRAQFQVNFAHTQNAEGERAGDDAVQEAFVIYRPTGQIMWALVDGAGQSAINLQIGADLFDLLE